MTPEPWFLVLSGVLWLAIVAGWARWVRRRLRRRGRLGTWSLVSARVTEASWKNERATVDDHTQRYRVYRGRYEFTDPTGRTWSGEHTSPEPLGQGDLLQVMHDPDDPSTHEPTDRALPLWAPILALVAYTVGLGLFAVITLMLGLGHS